MGLLQKVVEIYAFASQAVMIETNFKNNITTKPLQILNKKKIFISLKKFHSFLSFEIFLQYFCLKVLKDYWKIKQRKSFLSTPR